MGSVTYTKAIILLNHVMVVKLVVRKEGTLHDSALLMDKQGCMLVSLAGETSRLHIAIWQRY